MLDVYEVRILPVLVSTDSNIFFFKDIWYIFRWYLKGIRSTFCTPVCFSLIFLVSLVFLGINFINLSVLDVYEDRILPSLGLNWQSKIFFLKDLVHLQMSWDPLGIWSTFCTPVCYKWCFWEAHALCVGSPLLFSSDGWRLENDCVTICEGKCHCFYCVVFFRTLIYYSHHLLFDER